jgi:periplasmic divalent cation tolerance protein
MNASPRDFPEFFDQQRADYRRALPEKIAQIRALWSAVACGAVACGDEAALLAELARLAHTLAGTAGTLGFPAVSAAARALELLLEPAVPTTQVPLPAQHREIALAVAALQASLPADEPLS